MSRKRSRGGFSAGGDCGGVVNLCLGEGVLGGESMGEGGLKVDNVEAAEVRGLGFLLD